MVDQRVIADEIAASEAEKKAAANPVGSGVAPYEEDGEKYKAGPPGAVGGGFGFFSPEALYIQYGGDTEAIGFLDLDEMYGAGATAAWGRWMAAGGPNKVDLSATEPDWWRQAQRWLLTGLQDYAKVVGLPSSQMTAWLGTNKSFLIDRLDKLGQYFYPDGTTRFMDPNTSDGDQTFLRIAWNTLEENLANLKNFDPFTASFPYASSGGGGSAVRDPAKAFDINELTVAANNMWRGYLLEDGPNMRQVAQDYVEQIKADPDQKLDFETFVYGRIKDSARYAMMYGNKPESLSEAQFIQPYLQAAQQVIGPGYGDQLAATAIGGARLQASPAAFTERLKRTDQHLSSVGFFQRAGNALQAVSRMFQGS